MKVWKSFFRRNKKYNTGVILSGGGARGFAHAGILKALNESGIYPDVISGVSAGAIVGALCTSGWDRWWECWIKKRTDQQEFDSQTEAHTSCFWSNQAKWIPYLYQPV